MRAQLESLREENEQNTQVLTFKMEQIAAMQQATQEVEEKLAQVTAELNAEREARGKEASEVIEGDETDEGDR